MVSVFYAPAGATVFDEDLILVDHFLRGDQGAFTRLYEKYYDKVYAIARGVLMDAEEASDAVQEIFTLVYRHLPKFDRRSKFSTWLFRIAVNRSIQQSRGLKHRSRNVELTEAADRWVDDQPDTDSDPRIGEAMARLQPTDRAILTLFYWEDLSLQEVADSLGCNVNAAKTRLFRARERFKEFFEESQR
ncbi:MAG: RNA polymerase sigma factor [Fimbriimonadaceae bacterium]|nr:RNA polymerase sigma factor [Fimbriimonadaceae bacterium]